MEMITNLARIVKDYRIIGIDGRSGAGKTTLSALLAKDISAVVFHMDDYFLRQEQISDERLASPGENVDHERFYEEIVLPLSQGEKMVFHRRYDCHAQSLSPLMKTDINGPVIIEGSYAFHPSLLPFYDFKIFVDIDKERQKERIVNREGARKAEMFFKKWVPLEEKYFDHYHIKEISDHILMNDSDLY